MFLGSEILLISVQRISPLYHGSLSASVMTYRCSIEASVLGKIQTNLYLHLPSKYHTAAEPYQLDPSLPAIQYQNSYTLQAIILKHSLRAFTTIARNKMPQINVSLKDGASADALAAYAIHPSVNVIQIADFTKQSEEADHRPRWEDYQRVQAD